MDQLKSKIKATYSEKLDNCDVSSKDLEKFGLTGLFVCLFVGLV